jgi:hypothetical protein
VPSRSPTPSSDDPATRVAAAVAEYREHDNVGALFDALRAIASSASPDALIEATRPFHELPEVVIPIYESLIDRRPDDAQAHVVLANAYWLTGRGPVAVGKLAQRAIDLDASNRGAWHLFALSESEPRARMERWRDVTERFPMDQLARAALADNATSVAGAEHDPRALDLAIRTYEGLLKETKGGDTRRALIETLEKLRKWTI